MRSMSSSIGSYNGYYLEIATQVGIFVALALGLNIVVGLAGLLDLGYVAFFAVGAYSWAIFGSPQANAFLGHGFPLSPAWFFAFDALRSFDLPRLLATSQAKGLIVDPRDGDWGRLPEAVARDLLPERVRVASAEEPGGTVEEFLQAVLADR